MAEKKGTGGSRKARMGNIGTYGRRTNIVRAKAARVTPEPPRRRTPNAKTKE